MYMQSVFFFFLLMIYKLIERFSVWELEINYFTNSTVHSTNRGSAYSVYGNCAYNFILLVIASLH